MKYIGFAFTVLIIILIFFQKDKFDLKTLRNTAIAFAISIPIFVLVLMFFKFILKTAPDKNITIAIYSSFLVILALIVIVYLSGFIIQKIVDFQISIGNENKGFIKNIVKNKITIINTIQTLFLLGGLLGMYGIWIKMK